MSWISDLADKAENILNKIDQNAATVLRHSTSGNEEYLLPTKHSLSHSLEKNLIDVEPNVNLSKLETNESYANTSVQNLESIIESNIEKDPVEFKIALTKVWEKHDLSDEVNQLQQNLGIAENENKIQELQNIIKVLNREKSQLREKVLQITSSSNGYLKNITGLENTLAKNRKELFEIKEKLKNQIKESEQKRADLEHYRKKAQSTLQIKDKIIEELRQGNICRIESLEPNQNQIQQIEIENLKHDNVLKSNQLLEFRQEVNESNIVIQNIRQELKNKEIELEHNGTVLINNLKFEQEKALKLESEMKLLNQEISAVRQESNRQRQLHIAQIHEKEQQLNKLRRGNADYQAVGDSNNVEARLKSLTQALFQKQTSLETITSEKNALKLQLEKVEDQLRHLINQGRHSSSQIIDVNDTDDAKAQFPIIMRENPFDTRVTRRVKRAYSSLDSAGIKIGIFLRRYPLIRIAVLIYVAMVHLWVIIVLFSSTPS